MKILIDIGHPAHIHLFKNFSKKLSESGNIIKFTVRDKESTVSLAQKYNLDYEVRGQLKPGLLRKGLSLLSTDYTVYKVAKKFKPDIFLGVHNPYTAHVAKVMGKKSITFTDTENVGIASKLTFPFTDTICTPSCFIEKINQKKHVKFNGYKEIAYLHPKYFTPDPQVLENLNMSREDKFTILRFISWNASHDTDLGGITKGAEIEMIKKLEEYGNVFITSERRLNADLEKYRIKCPPEDMHSLLYYAQLYLGEGGTMATESAILGTPSIHIEANSEGIATGNFYGNFLDLRNNYDLLYFYPNETSALEKAIEILEDKQSKSIWQKKAERLFSEKEDVTQWLIDFIKGYPTSFYEYQTKNNTTK